MTTMIKGSARSDRSALVCNESLEPLGELDLRFNPRGAVLEAEVLANGKLGIKYNLFGGLLRALLLQSSTGWGRIPA